LNTSFLTDIISAASLKAQLKGSLAQFQQAQEAHYLQIADTTPYSPYTLNVIKFKAGSGARYGGADDPGYGIDTGAMFSDLGDGWEVLDGGGMLALTTGTNRGYADYQETLLAQKGGGSFLLEDGIALDLLSDAVGDALEAIWTE
jgi:hypothetical protein